MERAYYVNKVAILGAGVMGAQIAAHFANARISTILFDLKSPNDPNLILKNALKNLTVINPKPLATKKALDYIQIANFDDDLEKLKDCDLVIEAVIEKLDVKESLYSKISAHLKSNVIIASNTSGLSLKELVRAIPNAFHKNFCGIHFFNPPRYMNLIELIPHADTANEILDFLEEFLTTSLGKLIVRAKDTPNFIANRLGVFSLLVTCYYMEKFNIPIEVVDDLTGKKLNRAKSATFRTMDIVGIDTLAHVVNTLTLYCKDGWEAYYKLPNWISDLIEKKHFGQKSKCGVFKKDDNNKILVYDITNKDYREKNKKASPQVLEILAKKSWEEKLELLHNSNENEAKFLWSCFSNIFQYASILLGNIADTTREMDLAIRSGFGWKEGIFEIWQLSGFKKIASFVDDDIKNNRNMTAISLPKWVFELDNGVYFDNKHFSIIENKLIERKQLKIYDKQLFPEMVINEKPNIKINILYENAGIKLWNAGDEIGIITFKSKMCAIGMDVLKGLDEAIDVANKQCKAIVIWQEQENFSVGANLEEFGFAIMMNGKEAVDKIIDYGHRVITQKIRYNPIPIVAAIKGYTFGGGCEIMLHCSAVVASLESYVGLVEAGVGLLPGWGGSKEMAYRASLSLNPWEDLQNRYKNLALAKVATSAYEAKEMGFLKESDTIIMNAKELLYVAKEKANYLVQAGYKAPAKIKFQVFGEQGIANIKAFLVNMHVGKQISDHDLLIAENIASVMCGGEIIRNSVVSENWVLSIEKDKFRELAVSKKTEDRIQYMLEKGKPLRN